MNQEERELIEEKLITDECWDAYFSMMVDPESEAWQKILEGRDNACLYIESDLEKKTTKGDPRR